MPRRHFGIIPVCFVLVGSILSILIYAQWKQHLPRSSLIMPATRSKIKNQRRWIAADPVFYSASLRPRLLSRHKTTLLTTKKCSRYYHLLILVASAPDNFDRGTIFEKRGHAILNCTGQDGRLIFFWVKHRQVMFQNYF